MFRAARAPYDRIDVGRHGDVAVAALERGRRDPSLRSRPATRQTAPTSTAAAARASPSGTETSSAITGRGRAGSEARSRTRCTARARRGTGTRARSPRAARLVAAVAVEQERGAGDCAGDEHQSERRRHEPVERERHPQAKLLRERRREESVETARGRYRRRVRAERNHQPLRTLTTMAGSAPSRSPGSPATSGGTRPAVARRARAAPARRRDDLQGLPCGEPGDEPERDRVTVRRGLSASRRTSRIASSARICPET